MIDLMFSSLFFIFIFFGTIISLIILNVLFYKEDKIITYCNTQILDFYESENCYTILVNIDDENKSFNILKENVKIPEHLLKDYLVTIKITEVKKNKLYEVLNGTIV